MDRRNAGMLQLPKDSSLNEETRCRGSAHQISAHQLDGDVTLNSTVDGGVNLAHAAARDHRADLVAIGDRKGCRLPPCLTRQRLSRVALLARMARQAVADRAAGNAGAAG